MDGSSIIALSVALGHSVPEAAHLQLEVERLRAEVEGLHAELADLHAEVEEWAEHSARLEFTLETAEHACNSALAALQLPEPLVPMASFILDGILGPRVDDR
jgi:chromosome segregation ATPase